MSVVHDLGFAAYLIVIKNMKLAESPYFDGRRYHFVFDTEQDVDLDSLYLEYAKSDFHAFDRTTKQLKKMVHQNKKK